MENFEKEAINFYRNLDGVNIEAKLVVSNKRMKYKFEKDSTKMLLDLCIDKAKQANDFESDSSDDEQVEEMSMLPVIGGLVDNIMNTKSQAKNKS